MNFSKKTKLIIIRGPSGAGKSTVAREIYKKVIRPTLLVSEDQTRKQFSDHGKPGHNTSKKVATKMVMQGLDDGYDVIYEGILNLKTSGDNLQSILDYHPENNYLFYLDVNFNETIQRHQTRPEKEEFTTESMKTWWDYASPTNMSNETVIKERSSLKETVATIGDVAGLDLSTNQ